MPKPVLKPTAEDLGRLLDLFERQDVQDHVSGMLEPDLLERLRALQQSVASKDALREEHLRNREEERRYLREIGPSAVPEMMDTMTPEFLAGLDSISEPHRRAMVLAGCAAVGAFYAVLSQYGILLGDVRRVNVACDGDDGQEQTHEITFKKELESKAGA